MASQNDCVLVSSKVVQGSLPSLLHPWLSKDILLVSTLDLMVMHVIQIVKKKASALGGDYLRCNYKWLGRRLTCEGGVLCFLENEGRKMEEIY